MKLEMLELKSHIEDEGSSFQKVEEKSGFLKLVVDESIEINKILDELGFKSLNASDYCINGDKVYIMNFGHLI